MKGNYSQKTINNQEEQSFTPEQMYSIKNVSIQADSAMLQLSSGRRNIDTDPEYMQLIMNKEGEDQQLIKV